MKREALHWTQYRGNAVAEQSNFVGCACITLGPARQLRVLRRMAGNGRHQDDKANHIHFLEELSLLKPRWRQWTSINPVQMTDLHNLKSAMFTTSSVTFFEHCTGRDLLSFALGL